MAPLVRIAAHLRTVLAPHVALQLVDRRRFRSPHDVERDGLMGVAAEAANLKVGVPRLERAEHGRRLRRTLEGKHAFGPGIAGDLVGRAARLSEANRGAIKSLSPTGG